jgi:hypothetical protein
MYGLKVQKESAYQQFTLPEVILFKGKGEGHSMTCQCRHRGEVEV